MNIGKLIVLIGPSGVGKGTLVRSLLARHPDIILSISVTTRAPRVGEIDGKDYYFVSLDQFQEMVENGALLEWAKFANNCYGTPKQAVEEQINLGKSVLLEIELEGARQIRQSFPQALTIFILPPSWEELERRLRSRAQDSESAINLRLERAKTEIAAAGEFDYQVINDDLETTITQLENLIFA